MKYRDEFRDYKRAKKIALAIQELMPQGRDICLMEVCGTHTASFYRFGLPVLLPRRLRLISGPGCPVCVTPANYIKKAIELAQAEDKNILTTFGDMIRVPCEGSSLEKTRAQGGDIRTVYSTYDALTIAQQNPQRNVIFLGVGFETTAPTVACAILKASSKGLKNFSVLCGHKLIPPAMKSLLEEKDAHIDGFLCPGHVSAIIGARSYEAVARRFKVPCVIAGFEPLDLLEAIFMLLKQISKGQHFVQIQYRRVVSYEGNLQALKVLKEVFCVSDSDWRGLGTIPKSGFKIRRKFSSLDAHKRFSLSATPTQDNFQGCLCGEVLKGRILPPDCPRFSKDCNPQSPLGPCMVSSEGTCASFYKYAR
jgi:hydrogenase expression/formation protein HypD